MKGNEKGAAKKLTKGQIIGIAVVAVIVLIYVCCQIYISVNRNSITTEVAIAASEKKTLNVDMLIVRDEKIITASGSNIVSAVGDSTRVGVNDTVAYSFSDSVSAGNILRMREITEELDYYSALLNQSVSISGDTTAHDNRIMKDLFDFSAMVDSGDFAVLRKSEAELRDAITSKQTATGIRLELSDIITELENEYAALKSQTGKYNEIKSGGTGYYISGVDGYENILDYDNVDSWKIEDVEAAFSAEPADVSANQIGRLVHGYYWYLACIVDTNQINTLREGRRRTISFPDSSVGDISATVRMIRSDVSTGRSLLVFECNTMNEDLSTLRNERAVIILEEISGYRVDNRAIRSDENNEVGVYVVKGSVMRFKKLEIAYTGDEYSIVTTPFLRNDDEKMQKVSKSDYIGVFDEYIVDGQDLYDGKIIN